MKMKKSHLLLCISLLLLPFSVVSQTPNYVWARQGSAQYNDIIYDVDTDDAGNVFSVGSFEHDTLYFNTQHLLALSACEPPLFPIPNYYANCQEDVFVSKHDSSGTLLWAKAAGSTLFDYATSVSVDPFGNALVTGVTYGESMIIDGITLINPYTQHENMFLAKYDGSGNVLWAVQPECCSNVIARGVVTDQSGNVIVTGYFSEDSVTFGSTTLYNSGGANGDVFLVKYDSSGNVLWAKAWGNNSDFYDSDGGESVRVDQFGNIYVSGRYESSSIQFGNITLQNANHDGINSNGVYNEECFLLKLNSSGDELWAKSFGGDKDDVGFDLYVDGAGNSYVGGRFRSSVFNLESFSLINNTVDEFDVFVAKFNPFGDAVWLSGGGGQGHDMVWGIDGNPNGKIYVAGDHQNTSANFGTISLSGTTNFNMFVMELNQSNGNFNWGKSSHGSSETVATDAFGSVYAGGQYHLDSTAFGLTTLWNTDTSTVFSYNEAYLAKLRYCSTLSEIYPASDTVICGNNPITLSSQHTGTYVWSSGETTQNIIVSEAGEYSLTLIETNGCFQVSDTVFVTESQQLQIPTVSQNGTLLICNETGYMYQWNDVNGPINGENNQFYTPQSSGEYSVTITDNSGCSSTSVPFNFITVGISESGDPELEIYPNPSTGEFVVHGVEYESLIDISLYDLRGNQLKTTTSKLNENSFKLELKKASAGLYLLQITGSTYQFHNTLNVIN